MMLRSMFSASRLAGGAAVAAAASPDPSHARALQPRSVLPAKRDEDAQRLGQGSEHTHICDADWILAHVQNGNVYCEADDVQSVLNEVLGQSSRAQVVGLPASEIDVEDDDRSSCTSFGASADEHIELADRQNLENMTPVLTTLLNNEGVQKSIFAALKEDPNFAKFLEHAPGPSNLLLPPSTVLIEEVAEVEVGRTKLSVVMYIADSVQPEAARQNPLQGAMDKVGAGLIRLGEDLKGAGEHLGGVFVGLGNKLHSTINGAHAHTKKAVQEPSNHKDFWMNALGVVAIAVLTMLFAKGKLRVRTV